MGGRDTVTTGSILRCYQQLPHAWTIIICIYALWRNQTILSPYQLMDPFNYNHASSPFYHSFFVLTQSPYTHEKTSYSTHLFPLF